jgi:hypothetical protein
MEFKLLLEKSIFWPGEKYIKIPIQSPFEYTDAGEIDEPINLNEKYITIQGYSFNRVKLFLDYFLISKDDFLRYSREESEIVSYLKECKILISKDKHLCSENFKTIQLTLNIPNGYINRHTLEQSLNAIINMLEKIYKDFPNYIENLEADYAVQIANFNKIKNLKI